MKQDLLDKPGGRSPIETSPASTQSDRRTGWAMLLPAAGVAALVSLYWVIDGRSARASVHEEAALVASIAPTVAPEPARAVSSTKPAPATLEPPLSRITRIDGRYVIDLHAAAIGPALGMLSEATRTTVIGSDVIVTSPSRITTAFVANSPIDAWKGVFGDVANFALTCGHSACAVRFVSLVGGPSNALSSTRSQPQKPTLTAPPGAPPAIEAGSEPMPDN